jgi:hypothetical protein
VCCRVFDTEDGERKFGVVGKEKELFPSEGDRVCVPEKPGWTFFEEDFQKPEIMVCLWKRSGTKQKQRIPEISKFPI